MPNLPTYLGTLTNGVSAFSVSTGATGSTSSTASAQQVLAEWEHETGQGDGTGTDDAAQVSTGATVSGQTTYYVTPNQQSGTGNEGVSPSGDVSAQQSGIQATSSQLAAGNVDGAKKTFSDMLSDAWMSNPNIDINGLVQAVMRNSYEDNQQDLKYYALKVQFYNNLKKAIRSELSRARDFQSTHEQSGPNASNSNLTEAYTPGPQYSTNPPANGTQVQTQDQALAAGAQQDAASNGQDSSTDPSDASSGTGSSATTTTSGTGTTGASGTTGAAGSTGATGSTGSTGVGGSGVQQVAATDIAALGFKPPLEGDPKDWQVLKTSDGHFIATNFNQKDKGAGEMRVYAPSAGDPNKPGAMIDQVWGDPHMNTSGNEYSAAGESGGHGFNQYGQFGVVLPDGTAISVSCEASVGGVAAVSSVDVASGNDHYKFTSGPNNTGTATTGNTNDGQSYINNNVIGNGANNNLFALHDQVNGAPSEVDVFQGGTWQKVADQNNINPTAGGNAGDGALQTSGNATGVTAAQNGVAQAQSNQITTANQLDSYIQNQEDLLQSVGDDAQLAQVDLQNMAQKQQQTLQTLSNLSKSFHDLSMAIIRNISG